jgi:hypothetical protein
VARNEVREEYLEWLLLPRRTKLVHRMPLTDKDFADEKGVSTRTLRRWRDLPDFQAKLEERQADLATAQPGGTVSGVGGSRPSKDARTRKTRPKAVGADADLPDDATPDERDYLSAKSALIAMCGDGDLKALDLYFKHYGKSFIAAELEARDSSFADLTDDELIEATLQLIGADRVARWMAEAA